MITVKDLTFSYGESNVLNKVSLAFDTRSTAIIGQNGAGKTTLAKLIKGLLKPSSGRIDMPGTDHASATAASLAGLVGMVFQNPNDQIFKRTVLDEVMFGPLNLRLSRETALKGSMAALEAVGLADCTDMNPHDLGLSAKKLVCIASVLAMDTPVIILDEPTIAQDYAGIKLIGGLVRTLAAQGKLVIAVAHDMDFVAEYFERTIVMRNGQVLLNGETPNVFSDDAALRAAYVDTPHVARLGKRLRFEKVPLNEDMFVEIYKSGR